MQRFWNEEKKIGKRKRISFSYQTWIILLYNDNDNDNVIGQMINYEFMDR